MRLCLIPVLKATRINIGLVNLLHSELCSMTQLVMGLAVCKTAGTLWHHFRFFSQLHYGLDMTQNRILLT